MAETPADVKKDIEMTRERISHTLLQLEQKTNVMQIVKDHPWPALALAVGAGVLLSGSRADVKAAGATLAATRGTSSKLGTVLDDVVANLVGGLSLAFQSKVDSLVDELKEAIGAPTNTGDRGTGSSGATGGRTQGLADMGGSERGSTGMGALGASSSASGTGSSASTLSSAGSQGMADRSVGTSTGAWAPQSAASDHVQGLGGTAGTTPRAD